VLEHGLRVLLESRVMEVIVVLSDRTRDLKGLLRGSRVKLVMNPDYKKGMRTSIRRGLRAVDSRSEGILIALGDQPLLKSATVNLLLRTFERGKGTIVVPVFQGHRGHPVVFDRRYAAELSRLEGWGLIPAPEYPENIVEANTRSKGAVVDIDTAGLPKRCGPGNPRHGTRDRFRGRPILQGLKAGTPAFRMASREPKRRGQESVEPRGQIE
jgi:molybdenum cofactor cytidylyltransferase